MSSDDSRKIFLVISEEWYGSGEDEQIRAFDNEDDAVDSKNSWKGRCDCQGDRLGSNVMIRMVLVFLFIQIIF